MEMLRYQSAAADLDDLAELILIYHGRREGLVKD